MDKDFGELVFSEFAVIFIGLGPINIDIAVSNLWKSIWEILPDIVMGILGLKILTKWCEILENAIYITEIIGK